MRFVLARHCKNVPQGERVDAMTTESALSIVFTDVVGSTERLSRLGDEVAETLRRRHMAQLRGVIAAHGGREVKALGDGLMVASDWDRRHDSHNGPTTPPHSEIPRSVVAVGQRTFQEGSAS